MPKKKQLPMSKSDAIREHKKAHPEMGAKRIAGFLNEDGYNVSPQYVAMVLCNDRRKDGKQGFANPGDVPCSALMAVKGFVAEMGGLEKAKKVLDVYDQLVE